MRQYWTPCVSLQSFKVEIPVWMQDQNADSIMHIMKSATLCGMPKLLACCEYWVVVDALTKAPQHVGLRARCLSEQQLCCSWSHIAEGLCLAFHNHYDLACQARFDTMPCSCECCQKCVSCKCTNAVKNDKAVPICVPSPKEFLKMAAADKRS